MTPIGELRAAIPVAVTVYRLGWAITYFIAVIGNLVPVILLLLFLEPISKWLSKHFKTFQRFFDWLFKRTRKRGETKIRKYGYLALMLFVAIPLPVTGGWTGSLMAFLFNIPFKKAFPVITAGVIIAGLIVSIITGAGITIEKYFGWQILLSILLIIGVSWIIYRTIKCFNLRRSSRIETK